MFVLSVFKHVDIYLLGLAKTSKQSGTEIEFVSVHDSVSETRLPDVLLVGWIKSDSDSEFQHGSKQLDKQTQ